MKSELFCFETESHCVALDDFELTEMCLPLSSKFWDERLVPAWGFLTLGMVGSASVVEAGSPVSAAALQVSRPVSLHKILSASHPSAVHWDGDVPHHIQL